MSSGSSRNARTIGDRLRGRARVASRVARAAVLPEPSRIRQGVASALVMTESLRTIDHLWLRANLDDAEVAKRRGTILRLIASLEPVRVDAVVPDRAA